MKYFLDIECTQYSHEIISIGIVNENGDTFYSLIKPKAKISKFITELTGITNEMVSTAPLMGTVCKKICRWIGKFSSEDTFYCYGTEDKNVLTLASERIPITSVKTLFTYIVSNLVDYEQVVKNHFGLTKSIRLLKVVQYYYGEEITQNHNALNDAIFLKDVYDKVIVDDGDNSEAFPEYRTKDPSIYNNVNILQVDKEKSTIVSFENIDTAILWIQENVYACCTKQVPKRSSVRKKLVESIKKETPYGGFYWKLEKKIESIENGN